MTPTTQLVDRARQSLSTAEPCGERQRKNATYPAFTPNCPPSLTSSELVTFIFPNLFVFKLTWKFVPRSVDGPQRPFVPNTSTPLDPILRATERAYTTVLYLLEPAGRPSPRLFMSLAGLEDLQQELYSSPTPGPATRSKTKPNLLVPDFGRQSRGLRRWTIVGSPVFSLYATGAN